LAICSVLFGLGSALSFIDPWFLISGVIAVGFGLLAIRNVGRFPTVLTGKSIAQAGIGLALAFSLSAATITLLNGFILNQKAAAFGRSFAKIIASNDVADAMWYRTPPSGRRGMTPRKLLAELAQASPDAVALEDRVAPMRNLLQRAAQPGAKLTFEGVEKSGTDRLMTFAVLVYKIQGGTHEHKVDPDRPLTPDEKALDQDVVHAAIEIRSEAGDPPFSWYIYNVMLPYKKNSHVLAVQPVDDGHGHAH
jgi:hypothetical protein